jgi:hypothetical protein
MARPEPIPHPRRLGEVGRFVVDLLHEHRITNPVFTKTKHAWVEFAYGGQDIRLSFPCTPRDPHSAIGA